MKKKGDKSKSKKEVKIIEMPSIFSKVVKKQIDVKQPLDNYYMLEELQEKLANFRQKIYADQNYEDDTMTFTIFNCLDQTVSKIEIIEDPYIKSVQIQSIYDWYKQKLNSYLILKKINSISKKAENQRVYDKTNLKSDLYNADKYPHEFEIEHRTHDPNILPPKDRLKDFKRKSIEIPNNKIFNNNTSQSFYSDIFKSTRYGSTMDKFSTTNSSAFFIDDNTGYIQLANVPDSFEQNRNLKEIRTSINFYKPENQLHCINIEKNVLLRKNKDIAEKRYEEEKKEMLDQWGMARSQYKSNLNFKQDMMRITNYFEKKIRTKEIRTNQYSTHRLSNVLTESDKMSTDHMRKTGNTFNNSAFSNNQSNLENKLDKSQIMTKTNEVTNELDPNESNAEKPILNNIKPIDPIVSSNLAVIKENKKKIKITSNMIIKPEKIISKEGLINKLVDNEKINSDAIFLLKLNPKLEHRKLFSKITNCKEIDNVKNDYQSHFNPLSSFDNKNLTRHDIYSLKTGNTFLSNVKGRPTTGADMLRMNKFESKNLLNSRKTMSEFNKNLSFKLESDKRFNSIKNLNKSFVAPEDKKIYGFSFLPNYNSCLLDKPIEIKVKN